jgi:hypothetical protein
MVVHLPGDKKEEGGEGGGGGMFDLEVHNSNNR